MPHPLVEQLYFARMELKRGLEGLTAEDAQHRITPMNCISWNIGHLAAQEQRYWLTGMQGITLLLDLDDRFGFGSPASVPALDEVWDVWETIAAESAEFLNNLDSQVLSDPFLSAGKATKYSLGTVMQRVIYHYWYHTGENSAIRQMLGHRDLPDFVGDIHSHAPYRPA